jgi:transposase
MKEKKQRQKRRSYDAAFKANVLKLHAEGRTASSLAESFGINENMIYRWKKQAKVSVSSTSSDELKEVLVLKEELRRVKEERDILKKALGIFSRHL